MQNNLNDGRQEMPVTENQTNDDGFTVVERRGRDTNPTNTHDDELVIGGVEQTPTVNRRGETVFRMGPASRAAVTPEQAARLYKTSMCKSILERTTCYHKQCSYVHTLEELRVMTCMFGARCFNVTRDKQSGIYKNSNSSRSPPPPVCRFIHPDETRENFVQRFYGDEVVDYLRSIQNDRAVEQPTPPPRAVQVQAPLNDESAFPPISTTRITPPRSESTTEPQQAVVAPEPVITPVVEPTQIRIEEGAARVPTPTTTLPAPAPFLIPAPETMVQLYIEQASSAPRPQIIRVPWNIAHEVLEAALSRGYRNMIFQIYDD